MKKDNQLAVIVKDSGLETTKAKVILEKFHDYFDIAAEWEQKAKMIVVKDFKQTADMKMARIGRLELREKRIAIEKTRKELKEQALREGKAIDGIANILKGIIVPIEEYLQKQENFIKIKQAEHSEQKRIEAEQKSEQMLLAAEKAERDRIEKERLDNIRLKKEAEAREKKMQAEREAAEKKQREIEEKARLEREAAEEKQRKIKEVAEKKLAEERRVADEKLRKQQEESDRLAKIEQDKRDKEIAEQQKRDDDAREARRIADIETNKKLAVEQEKAQKEKAERERLQRELEEQQKQSTVKTFPPLTVISREYFDKLNPHIKCPECGKEIKPKLNWKKKFTPGKLL